MSKESSLKLIQKGGNGNGDIEDTVTVIKSGCPFYYGYTTDRDAVKPDKSINHVAQKISWEQPLSVGDYTKIGQIHNTCPYYLMRSRISQCDLAIIPYNYLIDKNLRDQVELDLKDSVIVFDEGHNIETYSEELYTFDLSVNDLFQIYHTLNQIWLDLQTEEQMLSEYQRYQVKGQRIDTKALCVFILKVIDVLESYNLERPDSKVQIDNIPKNMNVYRLPELFSLIAMVFGKLKDEKDMMLDRMRKNRIRLGDGNLCKLNDPNGVLDQEFTFQEKLDMFIGILEKCIIESGQQAKQLNKLYDCLLKIRVAYEHYQAQLKQYGPTGAVQGGKDSPAEQGGYYDFYVCICDEMIGTLERRKISLWCFNPSFAFQSLLEEKPRCVIFTSGTLAPLNTYASELQTEFPIKLENDHIIDKANTHQVLVAILENDCQDQKIQFSFDKREDESFFIVFAKTLARIFAKVPVGGILVFLPSYSILKKIQKVWRKNKLFREINQDREVFIEQQDQGKNNILLEEYRQAIETKGRAVFIAVCRGKLSEGIDFVDNAARCVIMAGIPYPQIMDPKVVTKKDQSISLGFKLKMLVYMNRKYLHEKSQINGNAWYKLQACRAVNQAIGRVIRHVDDFGVIILMDERYKSHKIEISKWLNDRKRVYSYLPELESDLQNFFIRNGCAKDESSFQRATFRVTQTKINGFMTKTVAKPIVPASIKLQYEYDIPSAPTQENGSTIEMIKGNLDSEGVSMQFQKAGSKRSFFNRSKHHYGVMDDRDEGAPFVENLNFNNEAPSSDQQPPGPKKIETPQKKSLGGASKSYKRKPYQKKQ